MVICPSSLASILSSLVVISSSTALPAIFASADYGIDLDGGDLHQHQKKQNQTALDHALQSMIQYGLLLLFSNIIFNQAQPQQGQPILMVDAHAGSAGGRRCRPTTGAEQIGSKAAGCSAGYGASRTRLLPLSRRRSRGTAPAFGRQRGSAAGSFRIGHVAVLWP